MNFSVPNAKKFFPLLTVSLAQLVFPTGACLRAQIAAEPPPASAATLLERMQKSLSRQMDSIAAMQRSVSVQQQAVRHQNGDGAGQSFFTLPAPARMPLSPLERSATPDVTNNEEDSGDDSSETAQPSREVHTGSTESGGTRVETPRGETPRSEIPRGETPWIDSLPVPLVGIQDVPSIAPAPIAGIVGAGTSGDRAGVSWDLSLEGFLLRQFANNQTRSATVPEPVPGQDGIKKGTASGYNPLPQGAGTIDYLRQMLDFGVDGSSLFGGFTGAR